jgi:hypothetical protein
MLVTKLSNTAASSNISRYALPPLQPSIHSTDQTGRMLQQTQAPSGRRNRGT